MTIAVSPRPVVLQGAAVVGAGQTLMLLLRAPIMIAAQPAAPLTAPGFYVITAPGLTIALDPSASPVFIKDMAGTSTIAASVDGDAGGVAFGRANTAFTLVWSAGASTWLQF